MFESSVVVVTGGGSGMGLATVEAFAARGAKVFVLDYDGDAAHRAAEQSGGHAIQLDVSKASEVRSAFDEITRLGHTADILITCAGIAPLQPVLNPDRAVRLESIAHTVGVNLLGSLYAVSEFANSYSVADTPKPGSIVMVASGAAFDGVPQAVPYSAAKGGISSATHALARELSVAKIRVNTISPGPMETPMLSGLPEDLREQLVSTIPYPGRPGAPQEFARLALHICENDYLNGAVIRLDGGHRTGWASG